MKIVIKKGKGKQPFYAVIIANNGKVLFTSEMYRAKVDADNAAKLVSKTRFLIVDETKKK